MSQVWARDRVTKRYLHALFSSEFLSRIRQSLFQVKLENSIKEWALIPPKAVF
jgi:hypothetical protein